MHTYIHTYIRLDRLVCLKTWPPAEGARIEGCIPLGGEALLDEVNRVRMGLEVSELSRNSCPL